MSYLAIFYQGILVGLFGISIVFVIDKVFCRIERIRATNRK